MAERPSLPDWKVALRVWWAFTWRSGIFIVIALAALSVVPAVLFALHPPEAVRKLVALFFYLGTFGVVFFIQMEVFRRVLSMDFGTFRVRIESKG